MASSFPAVRVCHVCGKENVFNRAIRTEEAGWPDLDTRPSPSHTATLSFWVQYCSRCGYCAEDVSVPIANAESTVRTPEYQAQLKNETRPPLANRFLCAALVQERAGQLAHAAWSTIHAAWACDDVGNQTGARNLRRRAVELIRQMEARGETPRDPAFDDLVLIDLLRRSGQFEEAHQINQLLTATSGASITRQLVAYEEQLIFKKDTEAHSVSEAVRTRRPVHYR